MQNDGKIVIIGAGHVGSHCAMALARGRACKEIVLVDKDAQKARSQALDVSDALTFPPSQTVVRDGVYTDCADAAIVVIAVGEPRLPGQTRLDMLEHSVLMLRELVGVLKPIGIGGLVITITNPADIIADYVRRGLGLDRHRVFGTGTLLDTARLIRILSEQTGYSRSSISAFSMGEHGDSSMVPFNCISIGGKPYESFSQLDKADVLTRTRVSGFDIINGKFSTEFGIGQVLAVLCDSILRDEKRVLPLSVLLEGEYGQKDVHCGVPCLVGRTGIESVIEVLLSADEQAQLEESCRIIRKHMAIGQEIAPINAG